MDYFVIQLYGKVSCLLCNDTTAVLKYNLFWRYQPKQSSQYPQLIRKQQSALENLTEYLIIEFIHTQKYENKSTTKVSKLVKERFMTVSES